MMDENNIDDLFRDNVEPLRIKPPEKIWSSLEASLEKKKTAVYKRRVFYFQTLSAILAVALIFILSYEYFNASKNVSAKSNEINEISAKKNVINTLVATNEDNSQSNNLSENNITVKGKKTNAEIIHSKEVFEKTKSKKSFYDETIKRNLVSENSEVKKENNLESNLSNEKNIKNNDANEIAKQNQTAQENIIVKNDSVKINLGKANKDSSEKSELKQETVSQNDSSANNTTEGSKTNQNFLSHISISAFFSPEYVQHYLSNSNYKNDFNKNENPDFSYTAGIKLGCDLNKYWTLQSGAFFSSLSQNIKPTTLFAKNGSDGSPHYMMPTSYGTIEVPNSSSIPKEGDTTDSYSCKQTFHFISIPLLLKYKIQSGKLNYYLFSGATFNLLIADKVNMQLEQKHETIQNGTNGLNKSNASAILGAGVQYNIRKFNLYLEPAYRRSVTSITKRIYANSYPYSFGLSLGIGYHF
ncbi:MAG: PorT family protein [Bacteroidetes bacterium]|nr:PorT family protein [Bacteroidota bacterium]